MDAEGPARRAVPARDAQQACHPHLQHLVRPGRHAHAPATEGERGGREDASPRVERRVQRLGRVRGALRQTPPTRRPRRPQDDPTEDDPRVRSVATRRGRDAQEGERHDASRPEAVETEDTRRVRRLERLRVEPIAQPPRRT